jgi:hypothetical protein
MYMGFCEFPTLYAVTGASAIGYTVKTFCQDKNMGPVAVGTLAVGSTLTHLYWGKLLMFNNL